MKFSLQMRNFSVVYKLAAVALLAFTAQGCKKRMNGIDNNQIVSKPYSLFIADSSGRLEFTNDGKLFKTAFGAQGVNHVRSMTFSKNNFIWVLTHNAHVAEDKELFGGDNFNFNPINLGVTPLATWQSMMLDVPDHGRVYLAGNSGFGVIYSDSNGKRNSWKVDGNFASNIAAPVTITSFTQLKDGTLIGYDHINNRIFNKIGKPNAWEEVKPMTGLPTGGKFFLSHFQDITILGDSTGVNGVWYSIDKGATWAQYTGLPTGAQVQCMLSPFDRVFLVGTSTHGIYRLPLNSTNLQPSNEGLNNLINIRAIAAKDDYYKNEAVTEYVYLATDFGLYRSVDLGNNWILLRRGNYTALY
jgi:hypothetical protein